MGLVFDTATSRTGAPVCDAALSMRDLTKSRFASTSMVWSAAPVSVDMARWFDGYFGMRTARDGGLKDEKEAFREEEEEEMRQEVNA